MPTNLSPLIERVKAASGPDREIDGALWLAILGKEALEQCWSVRGMKYAGHVYTKAEKAQHIKNASERLAPPLTASLDAVVALIEKRLPNGWWRVDDDCNDDRTCATGVVGLHQLQEVEPSQGATPPLALLLAFLTAVAATPEPE